MKIVIAMDSFKGSLRSCEACEIVAAAIGECVPQAEIAVLPMADGGEGTADAMLRAGSGTWIERKVTGPLPEMHVEAGFAWFESERTSVVEMAKASGLELLTAEEMNPLKTTTYGTGELIKAAIEVGAERILLAVGGSATVDGGVGAATALGWRFLDAKGQSVSFGGAGLEEIARIIEPKALQPVEVEVLCDVDNPLCGSQGAARIYGPQKGAGPEMVERLDRGLLNLARIVREQLGREIDTVPGAGAAGGLAGGAIAFLNARLVSGIDTVMKHSGLYEQLASTDWVITGEGCFDEQSLRGKVVSGIIRVAREGKADVGVIAGQIRVAPEACKASGVAAAIACQTDEMSLEYSIEHCRELLADAARKFAREFLSA